MPIRTSFYSAKGGQGTSVAACVAALALSRTEPVDLVDRGGDCLTVLGLPANTVEVPTHDIRIVPSEMYEPSGRREVYDAGVADINEGLFGDDWPFHEHDRGGDEIILVLRPCYMALRRALACPVRPSGLLLINEPGRAMSLVEIENVLGVKGVAVPLDPSVARAVDAGLLALRPPRDLTRCIEALVTTYQEV